ncbi:hypothetical protein EXN66_Car008909 [Channa argus]|uniref:Uncharacterized protein n=1 Tax=Channa argus TaxID=215402 RepID=A0A6G1PSS6_CHAAH|nr:hypothetical protein EXN66_Car008909 [Channa argus]
MSVKSPKSLLVPEMTGSPGLMTGSVQRNHRSTVFYSADQNAFTYSVACQSVPTAFSCR